MNNREALLAEAAAIVTKDRNSVYGNPEDNFKDIASLWEAYKGVKFSSMDVVVMNMLIKVARLKKTPSYRDGLVDIAGYAACGADIQAGMVKTNPAGQPPIAFYEQARQETVRDIINETSTGYPTHERRKS